MWSRCAGATEEQYQKAWQEELGTHYMSPYHIFLYKPSAEINLLCFPTCTIFPVSSTKILSHSTTVVSLWAIKITVIPFLCKLRMVCWISLSLVASKLLVASSRISMLGFPSKARASARRCFSPPDKEDPPFVYNCVVTIWK